MVSRKVEKHTELASLVFVKQTMIRVFSCHTILQKSTIVLFLGPDKKLNEVLKFISSNLMQLIVYVFIIVTDNK